jgi:hypothetical protein
MANQRSSLRRRQVAAFVLSLSFFFLLLAAGCTGTPPLDLGGVSGTAQALAQTAEAGGQQAGTALAHLPATATAFAATAAALGATAQAMGGTVAANVTNLAPTAVALVTQAGDAAATAQAFATNAKVDEATALNAVTAYASDVLGLSVTVLRAGGMEADLTKQIKLPIDGNEAQAAIAEVALESYAALLNGGAASVSYGSGQVAGDLTVDINASSLGAFSLDIASQPTSRAEALALARQTFPGLAERDFGPYPAQVGYAWQFIGPVPGFDPKTFKAGLTAEAILLAVTPTGLNHTIVSVVVGKGDFAAQVFP